MLWVAQQTFVIKLHQDVCAGKIIGCVEPRNFVEVRRIGCARDDVALKLDVLSLVCSHRLLFWIHAKVVFWVIKEGQEGKAIKLFRL